MTSKFWWQQAGGTRISSIQQLCACTKKSLHGRSRPCSHCWFSRWSTTCHINRLLLPVDQPPHHLKYIHTYKYSRLTHLKMELTGNMKKSLVLLLAMSAVVAHAMRGEQGRQVARSSSSSSSLSSSHSYIHQLHEQLAIDTSDPREDIRTNRILNMEGF